MSLLELLVAISIFALITIAVFSLYINSSRNYRQDERTARMLENGRFALSLIAQDLAMADFWGEMLNPSAISISGFTLGNDDCGAKLLNMEAAILFYQTGGTLMSVKESNTNTATANFDPLNDANCNGDGKAAGGDILAGTNILVVKRVANEPVVYDAGNEGNDGYTTDGDLYINTNGTSGSLREWDGGTQSWNYWKYSPVMYFIRDDTDVNGNAVPALCRLELEDDDFRNAGDSVEFQEAADDCLAEGIEHIHVEFGLDSNSDNDQVADYYKSNITSAEAETVVSARIYLLTRTDTEDPEYTNQKIYTLGSFSVNGGAAFNDGYYRRVNTTTVVLRNPRALALFK